MELGDGLGDDEPVAGWISPDDRLWRHPSEVASTPMRAALVTKEREEPRIWAVAVLAGVIGSMLTIALVVASGGFGKTTVVRPLEQLATGVSLDDLSNSTTRVEQIAEKTAPAIVKVDVESQDGIGSGSGVVFRSDGHILTNAHVVDGANDVKIVTADGHKTAARVVGLDTDTDIAVLKVEGLKLVTAPLGTAANLKVGQTAIAIGEPLGLAGGPSVSVGIVSAVGRQVSNKDRALLDMIQTDAPIAPGSSGGALLDGSGSVIGITTAIAVSDVGAEGLGFATPIDIARDVADQLIATGKATHVWLGIEGEDLDRAHADELGLDGGAVVKGVRQDSPADRAGISPSDVIVAINGHKVTSMAALVVSLRGRKPGDVVKLSVRHGDAKPHDVPATLVERPASLK